MQKKKTAQKGPAKRTAHNHQGFPSIFIRTDFWTMTTLSFLFVATLITLNNLSHPQQTNTQAAGVSPMLFGTNLTLQDANDQFLTSAQTRTAMQQMHVTTIRMPIRSVGGPSTAEIQAAQYIKSIGAIPLVVLKFSQPDPAGAGVQVVQAMNQIFGSSTVYYEFGNERDLNGTNQTAYTTAWNQSIPKIKAAAPNGKFGGPVNFQTNPAYIAYFIQNANPAPDFISWHEYTCGNNTAATTCIANIAHWATHISNTKAAIQAIGKTVPPIFITEWNYDPNNPAGDSRATPQFEQQFVTTALQELAKDGVTAAYQFVVTGHAEYNLVDTGGQPTAAGQAFQQMFTQLGGSSSPSSGSAPSSIVPSFVCGGSQNCAGTPSPTIFSGGGGALPSGIVNGTPGPSTVISPNPSMVLPSIIPSGTENNPVCSSESHQTCSYTDNCEGAANGATCEKQINGCDKDSSGNNVYICKNGKWVYDHWVPQGKGVCNFCGGQNSSSGSGNNNDFLQKLFDQLKQLLDMLHKLLGQK